MKIIAIVALIVAIGIVGMYLKKPNSKSFIDQYQRSDNALLVDIRTPDEYQSGHIAGAINVDFYDPNFVAAMGALGTDKNFFIYCRSGSRSAAAVSMLRQAGMSVTDLPGGIAAHPELL